MILLNNYITRRHFKIYIGCPWNASTTLLKVPHHPLQSTTSPSSNTTQPSSKYHTILFKVPQHTLQSTTPPSSSYHITLFKVPHNPLQSTTPPSSKYHTILFKVTQHPLQATTAHSSKYHTTLFKVPHHHLQSTTQPSSKYHTTLFKVPHHPLSKMHQEYQILNREHWPEMIYLEIPHRPRGHQPQSANIGSANTGCITQINLPGDVVQITKVIVDVVQFTHITKRRRSIHKSHCWRRPIHAYHKTTSFNPQKSLLTSSNSRISQNDVVQFT